MQLNLASLIIWRWERTVLRIKLGLLRWSNRCASQHSLAQCRIRNTALALFPCFTDNQTTLRSCYTSQHHLYEDTNVRDKLAQITLDWMRVCYLCLSWKKHITSCFDICLTQCINAFFWSLFFFTVNLLNSCWQDLLHMQLKITWFSLEVTASVSHLDKHTMPVFSEVSIYKQGIWKY